MTTPACVFRQNLAALAKSRGIASADQLSAVLGFSGDDRRWLRRVWDKGLSRPDPRRAASLKAMKNFFKIQTLDFWKPDNDLGAVEDSFWHRAAFEDGVSVTREVIHAYQTLQLTRQQRPVVYKEALEQYRQMEEALIADWVGGAIRGDGEGDDVIMSCFRLPPHTTAIDAEEKFRTLRNTQLFDFLQDRFAENSDWTNFVKRLEEFLVSKSNASPSNGSLQWQIVQAIDMMVSSLKNEPPSMREVLEKFEAIFTSDLNETVIGFTVIFAELSLHPGWKNWVESEHSGSEEQARQSVSELWESATRQISGGIDIETFVNYFYSLMDDAQ